MKREIESRAISRVMSCVIIYLAVPSPAQSSNLPGQCCLERQPTGRRSVLFGLASDGVYMAAPVTSRTVVSYTAFPPLPGSPGGIFLLHFPGSRLHRLLAGILPCEARTFLSRILRFGKAFLLARFCAAKRLPCIRQRSHTLLSRPYYSDFKGVSARPMKVPANKGLQSKSNESR